jgi:hypothetical protein
MDMNGQTAGQTRIMARGRLFLGAFVIAWLNLTVQPCLMAMEVTPEPAAEAVHATHLDHVNHSAGHDCDHCPPASIDRAKICNSVEAFDCSSVSDFNTDARKGSPKPKDLPVCAAVADPVAPQNFIAPSKSPPVSGSEANPHSIFDSAFF